MTLSSKIKINDLLIWIVIGVVTVVAFFTTYHYNFTAPIIALIWITWILLTMTLGYFTTQGSQVFEFAKEAKVELQKVVWPTRQETVQTTTIVMAMVGITGFILWGIDSVMLWAIGKITHLG